MVLEEAWQKLGQMANDFLLAKGVCLQNMMSAKMWSCTGQNFYLPAWVPEILGLTYPERVTFMMIHTGMEYDEDKALDALANIATRINLQLSQGQGTEKL